MEEIKVNRQKKKSSKSKIALSAVAIFLTCIFLFGASFIMSLSYLINPSPIVFGGQKARLEEENQELKEQIEVLKGQVERLEASVENYKNSYNALSEQGAEEEASEETEKSDQPGTSLHSQKNEEAKKEPSKGESNKFDTETTVTPENDSELSQPASEDITVVEIE